MLDEPTAALDMQLAAQLEEIIKQARDAGTAIVYVSHRLEEIRRLADRLTVLRDGVSKARYDSARTGRSTTSSSSWSARPPTWSSPTRRAPEARPTPPRGERAERPRLRSGLPRRCGRRDRRHRRSRRQRPTGPAPRHHRHRPHGGSDRASTARPSAADPGHSPGQPASASRAATGPPSPCSRPMSVMDNATVQLGPGRRPGRHCP